MDYRQPQMTLDYILRETFRTVFSNKDVTIPVTAAFLFLPMFILNYSMYMIVGNANDLEVYNNIRKFITEGGPMFTVFAVLVALIVIIINAVNQLYVSNIYLNNGTNGRSVQQVLGVAFSLALPLVGAGILFSIGVSVGLLLLIVPGIWLWSRIGLYVPLLASGEFGAIDSLQESFKITKGYSLKIIGYTIIMYILVILISMPFGIINFILKLSLGNSKIFYVIDSVLSAAMNSFNSLLIISFLVCLTKALRQPSAVEVF